MKNMFKFCLLVLSATYAINAMEPAKWYQSNFIPPNDTAKKTLVSGQILAEGETPQHMVERVVNTVASAEISYPHLRPQNMIPTAEFAQKLGQLMDTRAIVFSTPILTNAGRFNHRPLSACVMPPVNLRADMASIKKMADQYHQDGMGTGYNLSESSEPIVMLKFLNDVAVKGANSNKEQRPVGNMAVLTVHSPHIEDFVNVKVGADARGEDWKFNISVDITDDFIQAVKQGQEFTLSNGKKISAQKLFSQMASAAHQCGDPGLLSISRLNQDNPTPSVGEYQSTAPCAEVGLAPGETCVFGYINLGALVTKTENPSVDFDQLQSIINVLIRALDNILEISIANYTIPESKIVMAAKRKIGIGICGFADMLISLNLSYQQQEARDLLQDILNFISYHSKVASMELAKSRSSFLALSESKYMDEAFIINKYGHTNTPHVSSKQWIALAKDIKETQLLRHASTSVLPPTGRSALVIGASTGIEPLFSLHTADGVYHQLHALLQKKTLHENDAILKEIKETGRCPKILREHCNVFITATEITPQNHLAMSIAAQKVIDEAISKTINLPEEVSTQEIENIYMQANDAGLKGITVFRNNSRSIQPKKLSTSDKNGKE